MKRLFYFVGFLVLISGASLAQNVGIGIALPTEKLHVAGNLRFDGALMPAGNPGSPGQVLVSQGPGVPPQWQNLAGSLSPEVYSANATNNLSITTSTSYTIIPGLSITVSPAAPATAVVLTRGLMQGNNDPLGFGDEISTVQVTIHHNGTPLPDATDIIDIIAGAVFDSWLGVYGVWLQLANHWNIHAVIPLTPGVHTIDVRARNYSGSYDPFYVGGAPITPGPPPEAAVEGNLIVILFY